MTKLFVCATIVFLGLKLLAYSMLYVENGLDVIKVLVIDVFADTATIPSLPIFRRLTEDNCRCYAIFNFVHYILPMILVAIVQLSGHLRNGRSPEKLTPEQLVWLYAITLTFIGLMLIIQKKCRRSGNTTIRLFAEEHSGLVEVAGLVMAIIADRFYSQIDLIGAILVLAWILTKWFSRLLKTYPDVRVGEVREPAPPQIETMPESTAVESSSSRTAHEQHSGSIRVAGRDTDRVPQVRLRCHKGKNK